MIVVKQHIRKTKNGAYIVRKHSRHLATAISTFKKRHQIKTPIKAELKEDSPGTSYGHTDSHMDGKKPIKHVVRLESKKIHRNRENIGNIIHHELGHILDKEKGDLIKKPKGKAVISAIKKTDAYKKIKGDTYAAKPAEMFARAYAQTKSTPSKQDVSQGLAWHKDDFKKVKSKLKKL